MKKIPVIIDCDPGHDDAMALIMGHGSDKIDLKLVTTVSGNNNLEKVTNNTLNTMNYIGARDIPIAKGLPYGMARDYSREIVNRNFRKNNYALGGVHGATGLDGFDFPDHSLKTIDLNSVEAMADVLKKSDEPVTIVAVGPLTNVGLLIRTFPHLVEKIAKISIMGGTCDFVLTTPFMEFNTFMDPEATKIVFESGIPLDMYGYDVTYRVMFDDEVLNRIKAIGNQSSKMVYDLLAEFRKNHNNTFTGFNFGNTSPIHDACAIAGVIDPTLITESKLMRVDIETEGTYMVGATICYDKKDLDVTENATVVFDMDSPRFFDLFIETIKNCE